MKNKTRMVTLHKHITESNAIIYSIELDGVNTDVTLAQESIDTILSHKQLNDIVESITQKMADNDYPITDKEKEHLNKLLQCMI